MTIILISMVIGLFSGAGVLIAGLARLLWHFMEKANKDLRELLELKIKEQKTSIDHQAETISDQGDTIRSLQEDIKRMSGGCGIEACMWRKR